MSLIELGKKVAGTNPSRRDGMHDSIAHLRDGHLSNGSVSSDDLPRRITTRTFKVDARHLESQRILPPGATGPLGQPYKMLRTQVLRRLEKLGANTLAIVSPRAGDGKSITASNLAVSIASYSTRTCLLVDLDLRRPAVARRWGLTIERGVEDHLVSRLPLEQIMVRPEGYERLVLLPAAAGLEDPSAVLFNHRTREFVEELKTRYTNRIVLFDLPPVLDADDALAFCQYVDAALVVVKEGATARDDVVRTIELLGDTAVVGTVLNASRDAAAATSY